MMKLVFWIILDLFFNYFKKKVMFVYYYIMDLPQVRINPVIARDVIFLKFYNPFYII